MLSQDYASPAAVAEAKVKQYVGQFLALETPLIKLTRISNYEIRNEAFKVLEQHKVLDVNLKKNLAIIDKIKSGAYTIGDVITLGVFATDMGIHIKKAKKLQKKAKAAGISAGVGSGLFGHIQLTGKGLIGMAVTAFGVVPAALDFLGLRKREKI